MRYVAAYLLAILGGKENPSVKDLENIIRAVGIETDQEKINMVISAMKGQNIEELVSKGLDKLAVMPTGKTVAAAPAAVADTSPATATQEKKEEKKTEKKEESDQSDDDMGFGLFD